MQPARGGSYGLINNDSRDIEDIRIPPTTHQELVPLVSHLD